MARILPYTFSGKGRSVLKYYSIGLIKKPLTHLASTDQIENPQTIERIVDQNSRRECIERETPILFVQKNHLPGKLFHQLDMEYSHHFNNYCEITGFTKKIYLSIINNQQGFPKTEDDWKAASLRPFPYGFPVTAAEETPDPTEADSFSNEQLVKFLGERMAKRAGHIIIVNLDRTSSDSVDPLDFLMSRFRFLIQAHIDYKARIASMRQTPPRLLN